MFKLTEILNSSIIDEMVLSFEKALNAKYKNVLDELMFYYDGSNNTLIISDLYIKKKFQGQGWGNKIMNEINQFADKNQLTISLVPVSETGTDAKLINFYKTLGFVKSNKYDAGGMIREPKR